jgi:Na+-driven multidrug efflux pump
MGSLESPEVHSSHPGALVSQVLKDRLSLGLLIGLTVTIVVLAIMDGLLVLGRQTISLGFAPNGSLLEPVPSSYLLLLPILGLIVFFGDTGMGLYFFTRRNLKLASYALWIAGIVTLLMLMLASLTFYFASG